MRSAVLEKKIMRGFAVLTSIGLFLFPLMPVFAVSIPSVSKVASQIESRYNISADSVRDTMQSFNVSSQKKSVPEVSLFFSSNEPKQGEQLTARAIPVYFSNPKEALYYTWYIKRKDCTVSNCDFNSDGSYDSRDWRIAAARALVQNGFDSVEAETKYDTDNDNDGYRARFGGSDQTDRIDHCAVYDTKSGDIFELASSSRAGFGCPPTTKAACMVGDSDIDPTASDTSSFSVIAPDCYAGGCVSSGAPSCTDGSPVCGAGIPCCTRVEPIKGLVCIVPLTVCVSSKLDTIENLCRHTFVHPGSDIGTTGDGLFSADEEKFWKTNPRDPSTADNGMKDEANVVGAGADEFTWTYSRGDLVGVAVEGTSVIPTKHNNASFYVMWAFPKHHCGPGATGEYTEEVKGYNVTFKTTTRDPNDCIENNLVDPTEGGQPTRLSVHASLSADDLVNDETSDKSGDAVSVQATIDNAARESFATNYDWSIELSEDREFSDPLDITGAAIGAELVTRTKGSGLSSLHFNMNIPRALLGTMSGGAGYIRFKVRAEESFEGGGVRRGRSEVIAKFTSMGKRISAHLVDPVQVGASMRVKLRPDIICNDSPLDRTACRVIQNEIIGLKIDGSGLSDFMWQVNQKPLVCTRLGTSPDCSDTVQGDTAFFPVTGDVGKSYSVSVTANDTRTGRLVSLSRTFYVVEPFVNIVSYDKNIAWPKLLGFYRDVLGTAALKCPAGLCPDYSVDALQTFVGSTVTLRAEYVPSFIGLYPGLYREWTVDGAVMPETADNTLSFPVQRLGGEASNVSFSALVVQSDAMRKAMYDVWGISPLDSTEIRFNGAMQIEVQSSTLADGSQKGMKKYYALLSSYIPSTFLFLFRTLLVGFLILFSVGFLGSFVTHRGLSYRR